MLVHKHGKMGLLLFSCLLLLQFARAQAPVVRGAEYYIDNDPGIGNASALNMAPGSDSIDITETIILPNNISGGMHTLYLRTVTDSGIWSLAASRNFFVNTTAENNAAEYFYDTDPGIGNGISISINSNADSVEVSTTINVPSNLAGGTHILFMRTRSSFGTWSITASRVIHVLPATALTNAEYFFDTDPGIGNGLPVSFSSVNDSADINVNVPVPASLAAGAHIMYLRVKTGDGLWGLTTSKNIYVSNTSLVVAAEYFLDTDPGIGNGTSIGLGNPSDSVDQNIAVNTTGMPAGEHLLYWRTKSAGGNWSMAGQPQRIYILPKISAVKYWFDIIPDMAAGQVISLATPVQADSVDANINIPIPALTTGPHTLFISTRDDLGRWSIPQKDTFSVNCASTVSAIVGSTNACAYMGSNGGDATYSVATTQVTGFNWIVSNAATMLIAGSNTDSVLNVHYTTAFTSGTITLVASSSCGVGTITRTITITKANPVAPAAIAGPNNACVYIGTGTSVTYSIAPVANAITYRWTLPSNTSLVSATPDSLSVTILFNNGFASGTAAQRTIKVRSISGCGNSADKSLVIGIAPPVTPGTISGPTNACLFIGNNDSATYTVKRVANASSYIWVVPAGVTILSHPGGSGANDTIIRVKYDAGFVAATSIQVQASSICGTSLAKSLVINKTLPGTPLTISGPADACPYMGTGQTIVYTIRKTTNATSYQWNLPAGMYWDSSYGAPQTDTIIRVRFDNSYNNSFLSVSALNGCGASSVPRSLTINKKLPVTPGAITGPTDACPLMVSASNPAGTEVTYIIRKVKLATSYSWSVPVGASITGHPAGTGVNDTAITVVYGNTFVSGSVTVIANANCGSSGTRSLNIVRRVPMAPGTISGLTNVCSLTGTGIGTSYSISPVANAISYIWTVSAGIHITSGQGSTSVVVTYDSSFMTGSISVSAVSNCWTSAAKSLTVSKKLAATPGTITAGAPTICPNRTVIYSLLAMPLNATSVQWSVPAGASIISGQGSISITVQYPPTAVSDTIRVVGINECSMSAERKLKVTLAACPPVIARYAAEEKVTVEKPVKELSVEVLPNPSLTDFSFVVKSSSKEPVRMIISSVNGKTEQVVDHIRLGEILKAGAGFRQGVYFALFLQGTERKLIKLVKL